jgi:hypothetical protein
MAPDTNSTRRFERVWCNCSANSSSSIARHVYVANHEPTPAVMQDPERLVRIS